MADIFIKERRPRRTVGWVDDVIIVVTEWICHRNFLCWQEIVEHMGATRNCNKKLR
jgi:hypothetical protein